MGHTYTNLLTHVIFSTKDRVPMIDVEIRSRLFAYLGGIIRELDGVPLNINGPRDHVHILASLPAKLALAELLGKLKANSSGWVHKELANHQHFAWQNGYSAFSVSHSQKQVVHDYISNQEEHHRNKSFKEELILFLKKHEIHYDERYLWE